MSKELSYLQKQAAQLRLLNELSTKLQSLLESENFYQEVVNIVQIHFNYYCIHIWTVGSDLSSSLRAQSGAYRNHLKIGHKLPSTEGIIGYVIRNKQKSICNDVSLDPDYTNLSLPIHTQSQLCLPMIKDNEIVAVLNIESDRKNAFDEDDIITLEAVASQVAVSMMNRKLYREATSFNKKLQQAVEDKTLELRRAHERIMEQQQLLKKENKALKTLVDQDSKGMEIVGKSPTILAVLTMVDKIAPTLATVLIQGESGTGKELIARRLHFRSNRAAGPYVVVNCGALQESLLESELFGHEKGSFTGASSLKMGLAEIADGGSIFLDEIGEMSLGIQSKLLRFLQEGEFYRIGGKSPIRVDVRVVSATNKDLETEVRENRFREDLFYRFNTITLQMPPLRKRREDLAILVEFFLKSSRFGSSSQQIKRIDPRVMDVFANYSWPGNIRELQNTIERLKILAENNEIKLEDIPFNIRLPKARAESADFTLDMPLEEVEKNHILRTLAYNHGNKTKTAESLRITIKTLYNKLHRYGIIQAQVQTQGESPDGTVSTRIQ